MFEKSMFFRATRSRFFWLIIFVLSLAVFSFSQAYLVHQYTESDGLPSSTVLDITQDKLGRMWFASERGIASYDGVYWQRFSAAQGLPVSSFFKIKTDSRDRIWALSTPGKSGLYVVFYDGEKWHEFSKLPPEVNRPMQITSFELMEHPQRLTLAVGTKHIGLLTWNGTSWEQLTQDNGLISSRVNGVIALEGKLYVATDQGLSVVTITPDNRSAGMKMHVDHQLNTLLINSLPAKARPDIKAINRERHRIWLYGGQWLGYLENNQFNMAYYKPGLTLPENQEFIGVFPDYHEGVYISYIFQIYYFSCKTGLLETIGIGNDLIDEGAFSIFTDFEKNVWIACIRGVSKIASRRFGSFQKKHGLLEDEVTAVLEYEPGKFVFGHNNGLTFYDNTSPTPFVHCSFQPITRRGISVRRVTDIRQDSKKKIWLVLYGTPLATTNKQGVIKQYGQEYGLPPSVYSLWIDPDDTLWVGTGKGVYFKKDRQFVPLNREELKKHLIRRIYRPAKDWKNRGLYFATSGAGIYVYKNRELKHYQYPENPAVNDIFAIFSDSKGRLFLGTEAGLFILRGEKLQRFVSGDFKIERTIYFIVEDNNHVLWFGTNNGVIRWDGEGKSAVTYSTTEGLVGLETNRAAGIVDSRGRMWIGTNRGVSVYNSCFDNIHTAIPSPRVQLLHLEVPDKKIPLLPPLPSTSGNSIRLAYKEHNLGFHFKGISFMDETRVRVKTKLEGYEQQWSEEFYPYSHVVRYRNVPPGKYRFHLKVKNAMGIWSKTVTSPTILIQHPFYQRWWFYLLLVILAGLLLIAFYRYISRERDSALLAKEIKERTRELRASEEKYAALFEEIKDVVYISSPGGKLIDMNPAGLELFGFTSKQDIFNVEIARDLYANPKDRKYFKTAIEKQGFVKDYEITVKRLNGDLRVVLMTSTMVQDEKGQVVAYRGIMRDITEKKKLEQELERAQKMEAIGMLAGGVAHDLNNILTGLTSYPELLLMQIPKDSPLRRPMLTIKQTGEKAAAMVQDLLTLSRRGVEVREVINLNEVIRDYLESPEFEKLKAYHLHAQFETHLDPTLLNLVGSPIHLFKTIMNLISNAVEAMPRGGVVKIKTENRYVDTHLNGYDTITEGEYTKLSVSDTGVGISPENISRIFEPFYTRKEMGRSGTGLGMSVVWATVKDHNGYIDVKSQKGKGTTFELYFPITRQQTAKKIAPVPLEKYKGKEKILIIDDVEEQREVAASILTQLGYQASTTSSGEEAIEYLKHNNADLLIIDMIMEKGIDGLETYQQILLQHPGQKAIIVSGFSKTEKVKEMQRLGAGIYVKKPYTIEQIGRAIRNELDS